MPASVKQGRCSVFLKNTRLMHSKRSVRTSAQRQKKGLLEYVSQQCTAAQTLTQQVIFNPLLLANF